MCLAKKVNPKNYKKTPAILVNLQVETLKKRLQDVFSTTILKNT